MLSSPSRYPSRREVFSFNAFANSCATLGFSAIYNDFPINPLFAGAFPLRPRRISRLQPNPALAFGIPSAVIRRILQPGLFYHKFKDSGNVFWYRSRNPKFFPCKGLKKRKLRRMKGCPAYQPCFFRFFCSACVPMQPFSV